MPPSGATSSRPYISLRRHAAFLFCGLLSNCLLISLLLIQSPSPHARPTSPPATGMEQHLTQPVIEVSAFDASIGINTHLNYGGTPYANVSAVETALKYLGISNV